MIPDKMAPPKVGKRVNAVCGGGSGGVEKVRD